MGSDYSNTDESMAEILQAVQEYFPDTMKAVAGTYPDQARAEFDVTKEFTPKYAALQYDTLNNEGRKLSELGRDLSREEQLGAAETELEIAKGPGRELAGTALELQDLVDPEMAAARKSLGAGVQKSLDSIDPNSLTDGEMEQIARGLNRTNYVVGSPMQDIESAMTFGNALKDRRAEYRDTLTTAGQVAPNLRTGISGFEAATRRTLTPNFGQANYTSIQTPGVATSNAFGQNYMNNATAIENTTKQKQKSGMDMFVQATEGLGNIGSMLGGI
jgi:hypothetical protein